MNETVSLALDSFANLDVPHRQKRGLITGLRRISQLMFGTAMADDVDDLKERYAHLTNLAESQKKTITLNALHVAQLSSKVQDMGDYTQEIRNYLNMYIQNTHSVLLFQIAHQALAALEAAASSFVRTNTLIIQNLVDVAREKVTAALLPFRDLRRLIRLGQRKFSLTPLLDIHNLQHYYPVLDVFLTEDETVITSYFARRTLSTPSNSCLFRSLVPARY